MIICKLFQNYYQYKLINCQKNTYIQYIIMTHVSSTSTTNHAPELFDIIKKNIPDFQCQEHRQPYSRMTSEFHLICNKCVEESKSQCLREFFSSPVLGLLNFYSPQQLNQACTCLLESKTMKKIKLKLKNSKIALESYLNSLQSSIIQQCKFMKQSYQRLTTSILTELDTNFSYLESIDKIYRDQLQETLSQTSLNSLEELKETLQTFITQNQNPTDALLKKLEQVKTTLKRFPFLKTDKLKKLYSETCDPMKWNINKYMDNFYQSEQQNVILDANILKLADRKHLLRFDKLSLELLDKESMKPLSKILANVDFCFEIDEFRIVTNNDRKIEVYNYLNPNDLKQSSSFSIKYAIDLKYQKPYIYFISEQKLRRINVNTKTYEIICNSNVQEYKLQRFPLILLKSNQGYYKYDLQNQTKQEISEQIYTNPNSH